MHQVYRDALVWSSHTAYTLLEDTCTCGLVESPSLLLRFFVLPNVIAYAGRIAVVTASVPIPTTNVAAIKIATTFAAEYSLRP
jgi:hypothetical protein